MCTSISRYMYAFYCAEAETSCPISVSEGRVFSFEIIADPSALMMETRSGAAKYKLVSDTGHAPSRCTKDGRMRTMPK